MARKILLADDSVTAQNMGRKILADAGYEVIAVNNGSAALKKIAELKPDLVILDVYMPGYSGLEVCQRLKESQETARIPVLLTVGKLEPFKPEEAQRVRAEGFIVKPFEASELLSALSKLEDKVVPRAEPSKPGRFARAIAAAEEAGRSRNETTNEENGWKSRIGFPHKKTEAEEKAAEEPSTYNPVNRDLRTVVETAAERIAEQAAEAEQKKQKAPKAAEPVVDVAALAPAGLPKDVTPEEVAAIAAAAAQIQMANATLRDNGRDEIPACEPATPSSERVSGSLEELPPETEEKKILVPAYDAVAENADLRRNGDEMRTEEAQDVPVTMAATAESVMPASAGSRWTAVPVALEGDEATVSLEREMQKAYAAFAAEANAFATEAVAPHVEHASAEISSPLETSTEVQVAAVSLPQPESVPPFEPAAELGAQPAPASSSVSVELATPHSAASDSAAMNVTAIDLRNNESVSVSPHPSPWDVQSDVAVPTAVTAGVPESEGTPETSSQAAFAERNEAPLPDPELANSPAEPPLPHHAILAELQENTVAQELQTAPEVVSGTAETIDVSGAFARTSGDIEPATEPKLESETVKSAAAAWASWRQIRDTSKGSEAAASQSKEAPPKEFEVPESAPPETAARAVAAGAEQALQEAASASTGSDPSAIASIVDSVLADLRPKLMEEISRKMAEKK